MRKPRLLDLCSGVGGAARGYQRAGFHVTGVDVRPQPRYAGDVFIQGDAIAYVLEHGHEYDAIHASWPCQHDHPLSHGTNKTRGFEYPDLLDAGRAAMLTAGRPYVIEQTPGKATKRMRVDIKLCGEMFGLDVMRHRNFELGGWTAEQPEHIKHRGRTAGWRHGTYYPGPYVAVYGDGGGKGTVADWQRAMGIDWTTDRREIREAIPPAYGEWVGRRLLAHVSADALCCHECGSADLWRGGIGPAPDGFGDTGRVVEQVECNSCGVPRAIDNTGADCCPGCGALLWAEPCGDCFGDGYVKGPAGLLDCIACFGQTRPATHHDPCRTVAFVLSAWGTS